MKAFIAVVIVFCITACWIMLLIRRWRGRERRRQANLQAMMGMLAEGVERMGRYPPEAVVDSTSLPPSQTMRDISGFPPSRELFLEEIRNDDAVPSGWTFSVHLHEGVEQYLGTLQFQTLEGRFAQIPGVDACKQEDRDLFLFRTKNYSARQLRDAIWREFTAAAEAAWPADREP